jgi:hypothetical protein
MIDCKELLAEATLNTETDLQFECGCERERNLDDRINFANIRDIYDGEDVLNYYEYIYNIVIQYYLQPYKSNNYPIPVHIQLYAVDATVMILNWTINGKYEMLYPNDYETSYSYVDKVMENIYNLEEVKLTVKFFKLLNGVLKDWDSYEPAFDFFKKGLVEAVVQEKLWNSSYLMNAIFYFSFRIMRIAEVYKLAGIWNIDMEKYGKYY